MPCALSALRVTTGYDGALPQFFLALSRKLTNPAEVVLLIELAKITGNRQVALRLAKIAFNRDLPVGDYALPIGVMPNYKSLLTDRVDPALVHALSRQESEFNAAAKSPVGAAGLMQLMPGTARATAKAYKVKYDAAQLTNPVYNSQLGEAHLRDLIDSYGGSYFLSLAAYNAGGGRVAEWIKQFRRPAQSANVDPDRLDRAHPLHRDAAIRDQDHGVAAALSLAAGGAEAGAPAGPGPQSRPQDSPCRGAAEGAGENGVNVRAPCAGRSCPLSRLAEHYRRAGGKRAKPRRSRYAFKVAVDDARA